MHVHMLLRKNGQPVFYDPDGYGQLSRTAMHFIGGLLTHARSLCAITNPSTNSYKRLIPGFEAPVTIGYAMANRSAVVRIPAYVKSPDQEALRAPQPGRDVQPVLCLRCHSDGRPRSVLSTRSDRQDVAGGRLTSISSTSRRRAQAPWPPAASLDEALDALEADHDYLTRDGVFPMPLLETLVKTLRADAQEISRIPHPAEFDRYFDL